MMTMMQLTVAMRAITLTLFFPQGMNIRFVLFMDICAADITTLLDRKSL